MQQPPNPAPVMRAVDALRNGRIEAFGQLLTESHISLDTDYEVSGFELNMIVHYSTHFEGCIGARMTGAGFGGCCQLNCRWIVLWAIGLLSYSLVITVLPNCVSSLNLKRSIKLEPEAIWPWPKSSMTAYTALELGGRLGI